MFKKLSRKGKINDGINAKGFFRLNITEDKNGKQTVVGDSGWIKNQITNLGFQNYLAALLGIVSGSKQVAYVALGTGGAPAATDTVLAGEIMSSTQRTTVTPTTIASKTVQFAATFSSANSFLTATSNLSNIGLFATTTTSDTLFAGNTYKFLRQLAVMLVSKFCKFGGILNFEGIPSQALAY